MGRGVNYWRVWGKAKVKKGNVELDRLGPFTLFTLFYFFNFFPLVDSDLSISKSSSTNSESEGPGENGQK